MTAPMPMPVKIPKIRKPLSETAPDVILLVLGIAGLVLSGWSLGTLMHGEAGAPWPVAVFAVAVFDLVALAAGILVYTRRADPWSAAGARIAMTVALVFSAVVNGAHGYALGGWTTAAVLAAAPLAFEIVFELRHRTLTALVWVLFRKEAMARLKYDAWTRIAPQDPGPAVGRIVEVQGATVEELEAGSAGSELGSALVPSAVPVQVSPVPLVPSGASYGTDVPGRTELLRNLIGTGIADTAELRNQVQAAGFLAPADSYIRRLVRTHSKEN